MMKVQGGNMHRLEVSSILYEAHAELFKTGDEICFNYHARPIALAIALATIILYHQLADQSQNSLY